LEKVRDALFGRPFAFGAMAPIGTVPARGITTQQLS
jgi:hypothetical protein